MYYTSKVNFVNQKILPSGRNLLNLEPCLRTISLRLPEPLIARLKVLANKRDVPYQSLLKVLLAERLKQEEAKQGRTLRPAQSLP